MKKIPIFLALFFAFGYCEYHDPADEELGILKLRLLDGLKKAAAFKDTTPPLIFPSLASLDDTVKEARALLKADTLSGLKDTIANTAAKLAQLRGERVARRSWSEKTLNSLSNSRRRLAQRVRLHSSNFKETLLVKGISETVQYTGFAFTFSDLSFELKKIDPNPASPSTPASGAIFYTMVNNFNTDTKNYFNHSAAFTADDAPLENPYITPNQEDYFAGPSGNYFRQCAAFFALHWTVLELKNPLTNNDIAYKAGPILSVDGKTLFLFKNIADTLPYQIQIPGPASLHADLEYGAGQGVIYVKKMTATAPSNNNPSFSWSIEDNAVFDR